MAHQLKLYMTRALQEPVKRLKFPRTEIGERGEVKIYMHNSSERWPILEIKHDGKTNPDITIQGIPQQLRPKETIPLKVVWKPSVNTNDPLSGVLDITGELHIG